MLAALGRGVIELRFEFLVRQAGDELHQQDLFLQPARLEGRKGREIFRLQAEIWRRALPAHSPDPFGEQSVYQRAAQTAVRKIVGGEELRVADLRHRAEDARI